MAKEDVCCIEGCIGSLTSTHLHKFPKSVVRQKQWLDQIKYDYLRNLPPHLLENKVVCHKHFEPKFTSKTLCKVLKRKAIPTLFLDATIIENDSEEEPVSHWIESDLTAGEAAVPQDIENYSEEEPVSQWIGSDLTVEKAAVLQDLVYEKKTLRKRMVRSSKGTAIVVKKGRYSIAKECERLLEQINPIQKTFISMQLLNARNKKHGRKFSIEEKVVCLALHKISPKSYKSLQKIFTLPSVKTLGSLLNQVSFVPGLTNNHVVNFLKSETVDWSESRKYCSVVFDEVTVCSGIIYSPKEKRIIGLVDFDENERKKKFADHALVIMLRGVCESWKQVIAFYFIEGSTPTAQLNVILKKVVETIKYCNLLPIALICDQGASNRGALENFMNERERECILNGENYEENVISVSGSKLFIIFDPPHLLKGLRNSMLRYDILFENGTRRARWADIVSVYERDSAAGEIKLARKLTDECIYQDRIKMMKVKNCARVFSSTMQSLLMLMAPYATIPDRNNKIIGQTVEDTAEIIGFFDKLFDSVNGSKRYARGKLRTWVSKNSGHKEFWNEAIITLEDMKFVDEYGNSKFIPSLSNWILTLKSFLGLWNFLESSENNILFFSPRNLNKDPLENFFSKLRSHNYRSINPSCITFQNSIKAVLICDSFTVHSPSANCQEDLGKVLLNMKKYIGILKQNCGTMSHPSTLQREHFSPSHLPASVSLAHNLAFTNTQTSASLNIPSISRYDIIDEQISGIANAFVVRWVIKKILEKTGQCESCKNVMLCGGNSLPEHSFNNNTDRKNCLLYPKQIFIHTFGICVALMAKFLDCNVQIDNLPHNLLKYLNDNVDLSWLYCNEHSEISYQFLHVIFNLEIKNWCFRITSLFKGVANNSRIKY